MSASEEYFEIIAPICPVREDIAHSLLRITIRPIFYLGITSSMNMLLTIYDLSKDKNVFTKWINENTNIVNTIVKELTICCFFYDLKYDKDKNIVILDHKRKDNIIPVFVEIPDRDIYNAFRSFNEFKQYFYSLFSEYTIEQDELDRLILEENYEEEYFRLIV